MRIAGKWQSSLDSETMVQSKEAIAMRELIIEAIRQQKCTRFYSEYGCCFERAS